MIDFSLSNEQIEIQRKITQFAQQNLNENIAQRDKEQVFDRTFWDRCGEIGIQGLCVPREHGGLELGPVSTVVALEALGYGCRDNGLNLSLTAHLLACVMPILEYGSDLQKQEYLPALCNGELIAANVITEAHGGSDVYNIKTRAIPEKDGFVINGSKCSITNAPVADVLVIYVMTDPKKGFFGGITAFLLDKKKHSFTASDKVGKMGVRTVWMGDIDLRDVFAEATAIIGNVGSGGPIFARSMEWERICLGACHLGTMQRLLEQVIAFARDRQSEGKPIGKNQAISHCIADMKTQLQAAKLLTYHAAWKLENNVGVAIDAAITKVFVSETFKNMTIQLMQIFSGAAFREDNDLEIGRALRDALASTMYSGTSEVQRNIIAKWLKL